METVRFDEVEVLGASASDLECRVGTRDVMVPRLLIEPGSDVREPGDRGKLVIYRWLAIGLGLVSPFPPPALRLAGGPGSVKSRSKDAG
jgi:hypothetical protein